MKLLKRALYVSMLCIVLTSLSACLQKTKSKPVTDDSELGPPAMEVSLQEAKAKVPFPIRQPVVPFEVTEQSTRILETDGTYDAVELTYANKEEGTNLILLITNSKADTPPKGKKGQPLSNGSPTWDQSNENVSAIYWRYEGLTYALVSGKNNNLEPLYDYATLKEIANTIQ
ncbi:hypothetical protein [Paenibacillus silvae]|uniref:DUF4367 domain-containing protein n=1 Tax=Paenibacillus silvae TaxID=1325358 RepID=A0A2W6NP05_9BACL|nr:hypothetical protein [Paenibacillus silvae]PZT57599.1 hypothetical protein DN757_00755 [Paenibacillus silvae]